MSEDYFKKDATLKQFIVLKVLKIQCRIEGTSRDFTNEAELERYVIIMSFRESDYRALLKCYSGNFSKSIAL